MSSDDIESDRPVKRVKLLPSLSGPGHVQTDATVKYDSSHLDGMNASKELEVGTTEYVAATAFTFQGILKKRYTDFMVNEIFQDGHVVHLTDISLTKQEIVSAANPESTTRPISHPDKDHGCSKQDSNGTVFEDSTKFSNGNGDTSTKQAHEREEISKADQDQLATYIGDEACTELLELFTAMLKHPDRKAKDHALVRTEFTTDRDRRAEIHSAIRRIFGGKIESSTDKDGFLCLTAVDVSKARKSHGKGNRNENVRPSHYPGKLDWLERGGEYLHFTLYKENKDTMESISYLTRQMKLNSRAFQFAGTKDRRAVTAQRVSGHRIDADRLAKQNAYLRNAAVGNFEYKPAGLELGDLGGNEFVITLRDCIFPGYDSLFTDDNLEQLRANLHQAVSNLHHEGFLNYYGLQRFGTFDTRTDTIGLYILQNDFRAACEAILLYDPEIIELADKSVENEISTDNSNSTGSSSVHTGPGRDEVTRARAIDLYKKTSNAHKPLEILPKKFAAENQVMRHLSRSPTDYVSALLAIPRNLRLMYVHAYQSLVWNRAVTHRWQTCGKTVVEGDLVLIKEHLHKDNNDASKPENTITTATSNIDADGEIIIAPSVHDRSQQLDDMFDRARSLTAAEAASGAYNIFDIVLPLPGYDIIYPSNSTGQFYKDFMGSEEGGRLDPYDMRRKQKDFSLSGSYRKIMSRIEAGFDVEVKRYARDEEQFVKTDLEIVREKMATTAAAAVKEEVKVNASSENEDSKVSGENGNIAVQEDAGANEQEAQPEEIKDKIAVILKFQLGASQYATMALRELSRGGITAYQPDAASRK